jgi:hypothetical protein
MFANLWVIQLDVQFSLYLILLVILIFKVWICAIICIIVQNLPFTLIQTEHFFITSYLVLGVLPATFICAAAVSHPDCDWHIILSRSFRLTSTAFFRLQLVAYYTLQACYFTSPNTAYALPMQSGMCSFVLVSYYSLRRPSITLYEPFSGAYIHYRALDNYLIREGERQRMALSNSSWWHSWLPFCWDYNNCVWLHC